MNELTCSEATNAIAKPITRRTRTTKIFAENNEHKCKCQRNFKSRTHHSCSIASSSSKSAIKSNVNMQQHMQLQQQTSNQKISHHLQMPIESTSGYMDNGLATPSESTDFTSSLIQAHSSTTSCSSPSSPASTSSLTSSESSTTTTTQATPSLGVNLRVTGQCSQGGRKYMEDYFSVAYQHSENAKDLEYAFFGIFDGHGGAEAATFAKEHLMMEIINQKLFWSDSDQDVLRAIREGYIATHFAMWREQDKWPKTANGLPSTAGTTATVAFIRHEKIYIGHVGDSGIVLGYQNDGEKCWRAKQLTTDHKPESMVERSRIMRSGGKVVVKSGVPRVVWNRPRNAGHRGPIRHNTPIDEIPFLAVARSLGDLWSYNSLCNEFVVSPDPDVRVIKINPKTFRCLIFGTDGLWNVVTPQEAVNTVFHNESVNERLQRQRGENLSNENGWMNPSKVLVDRALATWSAKKMRADNTSVVTVILHPPSNGNNSNHSVIDSVSSASKLEGYMSDNFGLEYTQMNSAYVNGDASITYREMAEKYLPPEEYRNFNYYEDSVECSSMNIGNKSYYDERYTKMVSNGPRYSLPNTLEALEYMCESREQVNRCVVSNVDKESIEVTTEKGIQLAGINDNDDTDDEDCDDDEDDINENEDSEETSTVPNENDVLGLSSYTNHYIREQKVLSQPPNTFNVDGTGVGSVDETTTSSYMSTFAESYNTLLGGDSVESDAHMSADVSTSNSSSSYKSHSGTCMQELVQEQQRYQQQCMSEEEGYSLTKLETRREQQRCSTTGVQTFRIFQQQQQQPQDSSDALVHVQRTSSSNVQGSCQQNYVWEPRFPSAFSSSQRYQSYQQQQQQQQQQQAHQQQFMLEQQLKSLELNSLLQQEREEEQQVEFERQMELERFQQQQTLQSTPQQDQQSEDFGKSVMPTSDFLLVHGNDNASSEVLTSIESNAGEEIDSDVTLDEEYLLLDEEADDLSVQINEISSSSCVLEGDVPAKAQIVASLKSSKGITSSPSNTSSPLLLSPLPSSSTSRETLYTDALEPTSENSFSITDDIGKGEPKIIEKLEKIEILHEKPELVIEAAPVSSIATRSKHKLSVASEPPSKRRCRSNATARLLFPNIPNENQHQLAQQSSSCHTSLKSSMMNLKPVTGGDGQSFYSKRQLRSTSGSSGGNGDVGSSSSCNITSNNRKSCFHTPNTSNNNIDYVKRTLRTRNSLTKDLKAKATLLSSTIKRSASAVTTRFLRTQTVNLLNMHQSPQVMVTTGKKPSSTSAIISPPCAQRRPQQQTQRPLTTTTFNFINLRSRQIGGSNTSSVTNFAEQRQQSTTEVSPSALRSPSKSLQIRNVTANSSPTPAMNTTTYVRRNLRSLSSMRTCIKGKVTVSTSTTGLTNYCKSLRSQSVTSLVTPPPPSPKHLNPTTTNVTFAVTRARTANVVMNTSPATNSLLLNRSVSLNNSRRRVIRNNEPNEQNVTPILTSTRAQKRLRR